MDRYLVAAVLPLIMADMSLSYEQGGELVSAFVIGYFLFSPVFGYLGDRLPRPPLMALGVVLWSLATGVSGLCATYGAFFVARMFVGVGEASYATITPGYIKDRVKDPLAINSAMAVFFSAIPVGSALGFIVGGAIAKQHSWQGAFYFGAIPGLLLAAFLLKYPTVERSKETQISLKEGLRKISSSPLLWLAIVGYVANNFALTGLAAFVPTYGQSLGYEIDEINLYFGLITVVAGFIGTLGGGKVAARISRSRKNPIASMLRFCAVTSVLAIPFLLLGFSVDSRGLFLLFSFFSMLFLFSGIAPINTTIVTCCPERYVTLTQGLTIFLLNLFGRTAGT